MCLCVFVCQGTPNLHTDILCAWQSQGPGRTGLSGTLISICMGPSAPRRPHKRQAGHAAHEGQVVSCGIFLLASVAASRAGASSCTSMWGYVTVRRGQTKKSRLDPSKRLSTKEVLETLRVLLSTTSGFFFFTAACTNVPFVHAATAAATFVDNPLTVKKRELFGEFSQFFLTKVENYVALFQTAALNLLPDGEKMIILASMYQ